MTSYELIFEIDPVDEDVEELVMSEIDSFVGGHGNVVLLTVTADGRTCCEAALNMVHRVRGYGIRVRRLYEDLVTRGAIASRTGMTRQAVGNWIRGDRKAATPFPEPYQLAGGGLWLWGEVSAWIGEEEIAYPTRRDYPAVNSIIAREPDGFEKVAIG